MKRKQATTITERKILENYDLLNKERNLWSWDNVKFC